MKLACWKCVYLLMSAAFVMISTQSFAGSEGAKQALAQSTTNSFCSAGSNEYNPFEKAAFIESDQFKGKCQAGMSYVECLRQSWKSKQ